MYKANQTNKYVKVVILHAGVPDYMDHALSEREVREIQANMQNINFDVEHSHNYLDGISIKQNYISRTEETLNNNFTIKKGSWIMVLGVSNETILKAIKEGSVTGVSLETDFTSNMRTRNDSPVIPYKDVITKEELIPHVISFTSRPANGAPMELMTHKQYTQKNKQGGKIMPEENNITEEEVNWLRSLVEKFTTKHTSKSVGEIAQNQPTLGSGTDELVASLIESQKVIPTITKSMETIAQSNAKMSEAFGVMSAKLDQVLVKETATENQEQEEEGVGVGGNTIERQEIKNEDKPVNKTINEKYEKLNKTETPKKEEKKKEEDNMKKLTPEEEKQLQNKEQQTRKNINNGSNGLHPPVFTPLTEDKTTQERASKEYMAGRTFESLIRRGGNKVSFIMDDYYYADNVFPKVDTIKRRENFDIDWKSSAQIRKMLPNHTMKSTDSLAKWDWGAPFVNAGDPKLGKIAKPGMAPAAEGSAFLAELVYKSKFFEECDMKTTDNPNNKFTFIKLTNSLKGLRRIENEPYEQIKHLTEREKGKQIDEVYAEPYESYISIPWTVIVENLERGDFLRTVQELDMNNRQYNMGQLGLYAKKDWARGNSDEININDGLLQQLTVCHTEYGERIEDTDRIYPQGFFSGIHGNGTEKVQIDFDATAKGEDPISQMIKMSAQYDIQQVNGASNKKFLVSPEVYSQLQLLQINRETELEDRLIQTSEGMRIGDCPIEQCTDLAQPCGVWGKAKTDSGEVPAQYILLGNFKEGFCNCMREDFQTHWEFHQLREMYIGDTKLYWVGYLKDPTKILAAEVINLPSLKARSKGGTPAGPSGDPQDNQIEM